MKCQLSLEYIFLALISLSLIAISLGALMKVRAAGDTVFHLELFKSSALDIYNSGEELCAMGSGNSMKLKLYENVSISQDAEQALFSNEALNSSFSRTTSCPYQQVEITNSEIELRNEEGEIRIN